MLTFAISKQEYLFHPQGAISNFILLYFLSNYLSYLRGMLAV